MSVLRHLMCVWMLMLACGASQAAPPPVILGAEAETNLFGQMEFVEDPRAQLAFKDGELPGATGFQLLTSDSYRQKFSGSAFWLRATLHNPGKQPYEWALWHLLPFTDRVEYWVVTGKQVRKYATGGDRTLASQRDVPSRFPTLRYTSAPGETSQVYIRLHNVESAHVQLLFGLSSGSAQLQAMAFDQARRGILYGMPLTLALMAFVAWGVTRDRRFWLYTLYAVSVLGSWLGVNGQLADYMFVNQPTLANNMLHVFFLLSIIFSAMFARDFLGTRGHQPWSDRYLRFLIWTSVAAIVLRMFGVYTTVTQIAVAMVVFDAATPIVGWFALRRGVLYARWYMLAQMLYTAVMLAIILAAALKVRIFSYNLFVYAEMAFMGQMLLLSVAQYDRMQVLRRDSAKAERQYQQTLELAVAERTRELEAAVERADRSSQGKSEFLANMSHEIRTPINAIAGFTTLAARTDLDARQAGYVDQIGMATQALLRVVDDLLDFSRIEAGQLELVRQPFNLSEVADTVLAHIGPLAQRKGLAFTIAVYPAAPARLVGDPLRLGQVLFNLCSNAVKFTERGEIALAVGVVSSGAGGATLRFSVRDTGIGLSEQQAGKLFAAFAQADTSTTRKVGGSGLGLVICRRLAELMGGRIWVDSVLGEGSTFHLEARFAIATDASTPAASGRLRGVRVVLADDDAAGRQLTADLLRQEGAVMHACAGSDSAVDAVRALRPADFGVVLAALHIAEDDGFALLRQLRAARPGAVLPVLLTCAQCTQQQRLRCIEEGAQDVLARPIAAELLVSAILSWRAAPASADLPALLGRFAASLSTVRGSLETLGARAMADAGQAASEAPGALPQSQRAQVAELKECLRNNDTRADQLVAQLQQDAPGAAGAWLGPVAARVRDLDYEGALALLEQLTH